MCSFSEYVLTQIKTLRARRLTVSQMAREMSMSKEAIEAALEELETRVEGSSETRRRPVVQESVPAELRKSLEFLAAHDPKG